VRVFEVCSHYGLTVFKIAVGFGVSLDAESANDTSWCALATECTCCGLSRIAIDDETA
jgi:hypothetical protein